MSQVSHCMLSRRYIWISVTEFVLPVERLFDIVSAQWHKNWPDNMWATWFATRPDSKYSDANNNYFFTHYVSDYDYVILFNKVYFIDFIDLDFSLFML